MPFPPSERIVFRINPLIEVICQLRFPQILDIGVSQPAAFQNLVRSQYPIYRRDDQAVGMPPELAGLLNQLPFTIQAQPVHRFSTADEAWTISLAPEFLALSARKYHHWEEFRAQLDAARVALEQIYSPAFYSRVGLRYQDQIDRGVLGLQGERWSELLSPSFLNLLGSDDVRDDVVQITTQVLVNIADVPQGRAQIRHGLQSRGPGADDLYIIDVDYFTDERSTEYDLGAVLTHFNKLAGDLFRWAITPKLIEALGREE